MSNCSNRINYLLKSVQENPTEANIKLIQKSGEGCAERQNAFEGMKQLREATKNFKTLGEYVEFMKANIPLNIEEVEDGIIMHLGKDKCTCPMADEITNPMLCECTRGHEIATRSIFFGKKVDVEILESYQRGGNDCVIKIIV